MMQSKRRKEEGKMILIKATSNSEPSLCDWEAEREAKRELIAERIIADEKNERGCPRGCPDFCWPWHEWPDCKLGHKFLTQRERQREQEAMKTWDAIEGWLDGKRGEEENDC